MAQMSEPILFVSMDGTGAKSSLIRAHAARKGHQRHRQNLAKAASDPNSEQQNKLTTPSKKAASKPKGRKKASAKTVDQSTTAEPRKQSTSSTELESDQPDSGNEIVPMKKETPSPFQVWLPSCMSDRFVQMFFETMMPSYTAAYAAFNVPNIIKEEWPLYMNHEVFLWTEAAAIQGLYESLQNPTKPPSQKVLLYKAKAFTCLKQELMKTQNGQLDDYLVMSIFVLASLDLMAGDEIAHNAHKKILRTAFASAGGLHTYGSFVRNTTMRLDSFWRSTASEPTTPAVPLLQPSRAPTLPSHPFSPALCTLIGNLPIGFQELALQRKIPLDVLEVLGRIADPTQKPLPSVLPSLTCGKASDNRSPTSKNGMYIDFWESCPSLSASSIITPTSTSNSNSNNSSEPPLERVLSLALLIYSSNRDASNPLRMYNCITNGAIFDLCHDLPRCETRRTKDEEHCLFWIWSVTVDAMRDRFGSLTAQGEALREQQKRRFPRTVGTEVEEKVLERFWFASASSTGSCLFGNAMSGTGAGALKRRGTAQTEATSSPGASGSLSWARTESMDSWSVATPRYERDNGDYEVARSYSSSSQADETESMAGKWHGPGFGLLPRGKDVPELGFGKLNGAGRQGNIRCLAG